VRGGRALKYAAGDATRATGDAHATRGGRTKDRARCARQRSRCWRVCWARMCKPARGMALACVTRVRAATSAMAAALVRPRLAHHDDMITNHTWECCLLAARTPPRAVSLEAADWYVLPVRLLLLLLPCSAACGMCGGWCRMPWRSRAWRCRSSRHGVACGVPTPAQHQALHWKRRGNALHASGCSASGHAPSSVRLPGIARGGASRCTTHCCSAAARRHERGPTKCACIVREPT
jgi:hypothetical protein